MLSDFYDYLFPPSTTGVDIGKYGFENNFQRENELKSQENVRTFLRQYTHLKWRGYVQIHMQSVLLHRGL